MRDPQPETHPLSERGFERNRMNSGSQAAIDFYDNLVSRTNKVSR